MKSLFIGRLVPWLKTDGGFAFLLPVGSLRSLISTDSMPNCGTGIFGWLRFPWIERFGHCTCGSRLYPACSPIGKIR